MTNIGEFGELEKGHEEEEDEISLKSKLDIITSRVE